MHAVRRLVVFASWAVALGAFAPLTRAADPFPLERGDHICIIGNTFAERMQHSGWLETLIVARHADLDLVFRNLGYSGDEIELGKRLRSMDFGAPDQWLAGSAPVPQPQKLSPRDEVPENRFHLTNTQADVILACFGYNESFAGESGLSKFKQDLEGFLKHTLSQKYNGESAPRVVLVGPIAQEPSADPNLPGAELVAANNQRIELYTAAMAEVAAAQGVRFVDLFHPTAALYASRAGQPPLTINTIHLNDAGDKAVAAIIDRELFGAPSNALPGDALERLRAAINDKNWYWYNRYRTTDGYSTYGERAFLKFSEGPGGYGEGRSNYGTVQRELEVLDVMTANRDRRVWAVARGGDLRVEDGNLPPFFPVISNKPGPLPGGKHEFLSGEESLAKMTVHPGLKVTLFASEEQFSELVNPVQMAFDTKGRLWVAAWETYPHWKPTESMDDKLLILEDTDGDGRADVCKTFAADLHNPTGFEFWNNGVLVAQGPDLLFLQDTDGDDRYDVKTRVVHGLDTADTHHTANSFVLDPGGALYFQEGTFHHSQVETPWGAPRRVANGAVFRYEPRAQKFDVYVSFGFANPHGHAFDRWGMDVVYDGTGAQPYHGLLFSGGIDFPQKHGRPPQVYKQRTRPCSGVEFLNSSHFPEEFQGNLLVNNVIGFQGILRYKVSEQGSSLSAVEAEPILSSSDPNFRPADVEIGPDGAIWFTDWHNPIIGHMQHNLRDPSRDRTHGRVYRVHHEGRELLKPPVIAGAPIPALLDLLKSTDDRVRYRARIELSGRPTSDVIVATNAWLAKLDPKNPEHQHDILEGLWLHQSHNTVDADLLMDVLDSPDYRARAAATRVLAAWLDRVPNALELLQARVNDEHPRVRLHAIWALSFLRGADAAKASEIAVESLVHDQDEYLKFLLDETLKTLDRRAKEAK